MEHHRQRLLTKKEFLARQARYAFFSLLILCFSIGIGILGYHYFGHLSWIDALLNASMILTGMGPVDRLETDAAKLFASFYALFSGVAFLTFVGVLFAPVYHRFLHRFHLSEEDVNRKQEQEKKEKSNAMKILSGIIVLMAVVGLSGFARAADSAPLTAEKIAVLQKQMKDWPAGQRIAFWAERFVGTPYDKDPLGAYVSCRKVVCDSEVDCMYLVFRAVELGTSDTPEQARERALDLRFKTKGKVENGQVTNYDERFDYAEDMIYSGKWGKNITASLGETKQIPGSRGRETVAYLPKEELLVEANYRKLQDGDIVYFIKDPAKRAVGEIVGHLGIIKIEGGVPMLIHASGTKKANGNPGGGAVKKVSLPDYLRDTKFIGLMATRF